MRARSTDPASSGASLTRWSPDRDAAGGDPTLPAPVLKTEAGYRCVQRELVDLRRAERSATPPGEALCVSSLSGSGAPLRRCTGPAS